jgi:predicted acetyltransferase
VQEATDQPLGTVRVVPATRDQEPTLANLLELYIHDFSEIVPVELGPDGRFVYKDLPAYWREPDRHPFLITIDGNLAGFALVKKVRAFLEEPQANDRRVWDMDEFFIVRAHRRHGVGRTAAHKVWQLFPGRWQVRVMGSNSAALNFWQRAIDTFTDRPIDPTSIDRDGKAWAVFNFES